ncbi:hypothetical protein BO70DRAFT_331738 [Aspergillus heteromorphus CBS 117.55]|uniref:TLDc domain-containing protein n=1 Tax=Aspergillus heteromorphus CBS 117.55 TaxID=1448321 RepID=A0A317WPC7_9EURO|nr:uncharacterized protein BO70DRAFT_331738 [Aspergillus heteromorphus CBS 117.55]PWY88364.1 hypothetical protein BO70DRAFT_331738 [Aspergillus heteromorphus CBS 117.55]
MAALLDKVLFRMVFGDRKKKLDKFLRTTTPDSVLSNLHTCLVREGSTSITSQAVFDASSIRDSPQEQPYWTKKSFQNHLVRTHPDTTIPDTAINVLWTCFCFFAYHPFPLPSADDTKLYLPAFERALILLSVQGARLLGVADSDFGHRWGRHDEPCNCSFRTIRILRSISLVNRQSSNFAPQVAGFDTFNTDDAVDALLSIVPFHPKVNASPRDLKPLAERLLEGRRTDQYQIKVIDLAALLGLIMRLRVYDKPTWGSRDFHYGSFEDTTPGKEELAHILARSFCSGQEDKYLAPDTVLRALDILPNLEQWVHQLWAAIFQPCTSTESPKPNLLETQSSRSSPPLPPDTTTMDEILRAVSLFIPPFHPHKRTDQVRKLKPITFEKCYDDSIPSQSLTDSSGISLDMDLGHILQQFSEDNHPNRLSQSRLVLFLGHQAQDSSKDVPIVVGAFFPTTPAAKREEEKEPTERTVGDKSTISPLPVPQFLFQLQPTFRLFRWNGEGSSVTGTATATGYTDPHPTSNSNYLGDPIRSKVGVEIDSVTGQATFLRGTNRVSDGDGYEEVTVTVPSNSKKHDGTDTVHGDDGGQDQQARKTTFTVTRIALFNVDGGPNYDYENSW